MNPTLFAKVLLVLDGLDTSMAAANLAVRMGREFGSAITAVFVVDTPTMDFLLQQHVLLNDERDDFERQMGATADHFLNYVADLGKQNGVAIAGLSRKGRLSQVALQLARQIEADVIVVGGARSSSTRHDFASLERQFLMEECRSPVIVVRN